MRKQIILTAILVAILNFVQSQTKIQIKSCKIDFAFSSPYFKGTKTIIFTDSGKIEKVIGEEYMDTSLNSVFKKNIISKPKIVHSLEIKTYDFIYSIDLDSMTGIRRPRFNFSGNLSPFMDSLSEKIGEDTFLNRKCDIVNFGGVKIWYWKGIVIKKEFPGEDTKQKTYEYATSIDENYVIKQDDFKVPKGVKIK
jgi:hypothetical protein